MTVPREPLVIRGALVGAAVALLHVLIALGLVPTGLETSLVVAIDATGTAVLVVWTRGKVTPVADPRSVDGEPLVPVTDPFEAPPPELTSAPVLPKGGVPPLSA